MIEVNSPAARPPGWRGRRSGDRCGRAGAQAGSGSRRRSRAGRLAAPAEPDRQSPSAMTTSCSGGGRSRASTRARRAGAGCAPPSARPAASRRRSWRASTLPMLIVGTERDRLVSAAAIRRAAARCCRRRSSSCRRRGGARNAARGRPVRLAALAGSTLSSTARRPVSATLRHRDRRRGHGGREPRRRAGRRRPRCCCSRRRSQPGYHSTGRSAAFWSETYGGPLIQPLTSASGPFLAARPPTFAIAAS